MTANPSSPQPRGRRLPAWPGRTIGIITLSIAAVAAAVWFGTSAAQAGTFEAGRAVVTQPGESTPLNSGGSQTPFGLALPSNARCPGDSAHGYYHVFSYLVPQGTDPASVSFKTALPSRGFGLFTQIEYYGAVNTAPITGQIVDIPPEFVWTRLTSSDLIPSGATTDVWQGGLACATAAGRVARYWNVDVRFTAGRADAAGFVWAVTKPVAPSDQPIPWQVIAPVLIGLALGVGFLRLTRPRPARPPKRGRPVLAAGPSRRGPQT